MTRGTARALLAVLFLLVAAVDVAWLYRDHSSLPFTDSYSYLTKLIEFLERFDLRSPFTLWGELGKLSLVGRPPLYQLATIPAIGLLGRSEDAAVLVNLPFLALLVVSTYHVGRIVRGRESGLLASLLVVGYPPIVHLSRAYMPHFALPALCALNLWLLLSLVERRSIRVAWLLGLTTACGLWTHPYFAAVSAVPTVLVGLYLFFSAGGPDRPTLKSGIAAGLGSRLRDRFVLYGLVPAGAFALALLLLWYADWGTRSFDQFQGLAAGRQRVNGFSSLDPSWGWYARTAPGALTHVLAASAAIGLLSAIVRRTRYGVLLAVTLVSAYAILSSVHLVGWMYFAPALPVVAVLSAVWIFELRRRWLRRTLAGISCAAAVFSFAFVTWGGESWGKTLPHFLGSPLRTDPATCSSPAITAVLCPASAQRWSWPWAAARDRVVADPGCREDRRCRILMVDISPTAPLAFRYSLFAGRAHRKVEVRPVVGSKRVLVRTYDFAALLTAEYLLHPTRGKAPFKYQRATLKFLRAPPPEFAAAHRTIATFETPLRRVGKLKLVQRIQPLTAGEALSSIAAMDLSERNKVAGYAVVARRLAAKGAHAEAAEASELAELAELYRRGLAESPEVLVLRLALAEVYDKLGEGAAAVAELEKAVELAPRRIRLLIALAEAHVTLGQREEAIRVYERVLSIAPRHGKARRALRQLGE